MTIGKTSPVFEVKGDGSIEISGDRIESITLDSITVASPVVLEINKEDQPVAVISKSDPRSVQPVAIALASLDGAASQIVAELVTRGDVTDPRIEERLVREINRRRRLTK